MQVAGFEWKGNKVLVTGASGFKGSWLCAALLRLGADVYGTVRAQMNPLAAYNVLELDKQITKVSADVSDPQAVYDMINSVEPDVIIHLAAKALVPVSLRDPRRTYEVNVLGTVNIIEACRRLRVCSRLLVCSTDHVFGSVSVVPPCGFDENQHVSYGGPYDTSKSMMELAVRSYDSAYWDELPAIALTRCANVFGYGDINQRRVIPLFVRSCIQRGVINLRYRKNGRQFIHITDAIAGYLLAASHLGDGGSLQRGKERPETGSLFTPTYHFAIEDYDNTDDAYISMESLADLTAEIYGSRVDEDGCVDHAPNENIIQALNCAHTRKALGWEASKALSVGLRELGAWFTEPRSCESLRRLIEKELDELVAEKLAA